jgi:hypothetical protein
VSGGLLIIRALALALPDATESAHLGTPDFRVRGKIFATASDDHARAVLKLPVHIQEALIHSDPAVFSLIPGWGKHGWTYVDIDKIDGDHLKELLEIAWRQVAPKRLAAAYAVAPETADD